jgi:hypothetical protein
MHSLTRILIGAFLALLICAAEGALFAIDAGIA